MAEKDIYLQTIDLEEGRVLEKVNIHLTRHSMQLLENYPLTYSWESGVLHVQGIANVL